MKFLKGKFWLNEWMVVRRFCAERYKTGVICHGLPKAFSL
jgi:hypothetical protein